jgi:hypothetical protein
MYEKVKPPHGGQWLVVSVQKIRREPFLRKLKIEVAGK